MGELVIPICTESNGIVIPFFLPNANQTCAIAIATFMNLRVSLSIFKLARS